MGIEVRGVRFEVIRGDITTVGTEALVNAANNHFWMGGGVAGALKRAGGGNIETEAMSRGPVEIGEAIVTRAGGLSARYVIHAAVMGQDLTTDSQAIARATRSSLERAAELGVRSIAFPAFGTGVGRFSARESAVAMTRAGFEFVNETRDQSGPPALLLERIVFVLFSDELRQEFEHALDDIQSR